MASKAKGIIVEIGGDTSGLQKALSKVNSVTASLSKELKKVNSSLKLDPKNAELLQQKQKLLNDEIAVTSKKLEELKQHQEDVKDSGQTLTKEEQENYRALQREIVNTEEKLKKLKLEASNWTKAGRSIEEFGNKISGISNKIDKMGTTLTTRLTLPILGIATGLVNASKEFETAFTGVEKTVDGTAEQMEKLKQGIKDLAEELPSSTTEIAGVAEAAGQLGIQTDNVLEFTKTMINMGNATNLSADEAATTLARFANVTKMSQSDFGKLGSVIVALGNNFATTEAEIAAMGMNLASAGTQVGMSQSEIMALATALSSVGLEAQAGGTAFSKVMVNMQLAAEKGGKDLKNFASVAGMSSKEFQKAFKEDATKAIMAFVDGLSKSGERGKSAIKILDDMEIKETRLRDALLRSANASDIMSKAIDLGNKEWKDNTALTKEANKRYQTLDSRLEMTKNKIKNVATNTGDKLTPTFNKLLDKVDGLIDKFNGLNEEETVNILKTAGIVAAIGPAIKILGTLGGGVSNTIKGIGTLSQAIGVLKTGAESSNAAANSLAKGIGALTNPATLATVGITALTTAIVIAMKNANKETKEAFSNMSEASSDFIKGIDLAQSHLDAFNSELFVSSEEQQKLKEQMNEVQKGITDICKTASDERRGYTQEEITQLDQYFAKLRELNQREIQIQQEIAGAISQQAIQNSETFKGSLEEYKVQSQEWLKTAEEQKEKTIQLINKQTIEEVALLNTRYATEDERQTEAYQNEYSKIMAHKEEKIAQANDEIRRINETYTNGYANRIKENDNFFSTIQEYTNKQEELQKNHNEKLKKIEEEGYSNGVSANKRKTAENIAFYAKQKQNWNDMYENMSKEQENELGVWLAMVSQTELYGGKIDEETKHLVDSILDSYDSMPKGTQDAMKNAMQPMLEEMQKKEPSLFAKATNIADGILSRLKKAFDIHSPSKETRDIFQNVMKGAELGLEDEQKRLNKEIDKIAEQIKTDFKSIIPNMHGIKQSIIDRTNTVFTTPQIVFNVQELDEAKLQQCFNYINRKFGSQY